MQVNGKTQYSGPDEFRHIYLWVHTDAEGEAIAASLNRQEYTCNGKWAAGTFKVIHIPGRLPAVAGDLTGN